jgi:hypothetical protein
MHTFPNMYNTFNNKQRSLEHIQSLPKSDILCNNQTTLFPSEFNGSSSSSSSSSSSLIGTSAACIDIRDQKVYTHINKHN